ncbi:MAG TPA: prepilin-type N-terminal cleavage/methylation domain-containing protein [Lacunisphaera sp.]|nr:prepilin-type N-terminal cleavage/methylation domain-containing protein [Lacunisphaera sp.]HQY05188.1 prepilin-type N-terminal cleavage/methylation domain-containing protein [Lacunisphaera sp.]
MKPARRAAFTLVEVMVASTVLVFGIVTAVATSQSGLQALDTARNLTAASQIMQSEMERIRLLSWTQLDALQQSGETRVATATTADLARVTCIREITDLKIDMKQITLTAGWRGYDGREHTARLITRYGKSGLNDYFYTTH